MHDGGERVGEVTLFQRILEFDGLDGRRGGENRRFAHAAWVSPGRQAAQAMGARVCPVSCAGPWARDRGMRDRGYAGPYKARPGLPAAGDKRWPWRARGLPFCPTFGLPAVG